jgi:hypothetical protein
MEARWPGLLPPLSALRQFNDVVGNGAEGIFTGSGYSGSKKWKLSVAFAGVPLMSAVRGTVLRHHCFSRA